MKIIYTKHALNKFLLFQKRDIKISMSEVDKTINLPENIDYESDTPKIIVSRKLNLKQVLRVVYLREGDIIKIITFYSAEKGRYY